MLKQFLLVMLILNATLTASTSKLIKPDTQIIDVGSRLPIDPNVITIPKDWIEIDAKIRQIDNLIIPKARIETKDTCIVDENGVENCPIESVDCNDNSQYKDGVATKHASFKEIPTVKSKYKPTQFNKETLSFGVEWNQNDIDLYANGYDANGNRIISMGAYHNHSLNMGEASIWHNAHTLGDSTSGGKEGAVIDVASWKAQGVVKVNYYLYSYSQLPLNDYNANCYFYDIKNHKQTFALRGGEVSKVIMSYDLRNNKITYIDPSVVLPDTDYYTCPENYYRSDDSKNPYYAGTCRIDYNYYTYSCPKELSDPSPNVTWADANQNGKWTGPIISSGGDCGGNNLNDKLECNNATPPAKNCIRKFYMCPIDNEKKCTKMPSASIAENIEDGYIYDKGYSVEYKETSIKAKACKDGGVYDSSSNICISPNSYRCALPNFIYNEEVKECVQQPHCDGIMQDGKCLTKVKTNCKNGYTYNEFLDKCEAEPFCDKGTYNPDTDKCEETPSESGCPDGFEYSELHGRCQMNLTTYKRDTCEAGYTFDSNKNKCIMALVNFSDWTALGDGQWDVSDTYVTQQINGNPTYFLTPYTLGSGVNISGKFKIENDGDDDWAGLVFGWENGQTYVFDWKKHNQGNAKQGISISRSTSPYNVDDMWNHNNSLQVLASNFNYRGWSYNTWYDLRVEYNQGYIDAYIDNSRVLHYTNPDLFISGGKVGFYNYSQSKVTYAGFRIEAEPKCHNGDTYDIYHNECYKDLPNVNEDLDLKLYWAYPSCGSGNFNIKDKICEYNPTCTFDGVLNGVFDKCQAEANKYCTIYDDYLLNTNTNMYEATPICSTGEYNSDTGKCDVTPTDIDCPNNGKYSFENKRCELPLVLIEKDKCEDNYNFDTLTKKCILNLTKFDDWTSEGDGNWVVDGNKVTQTINGYPTYFLTPYTIGNAGSISGDFEINANDDDWAGLVFGWENGQTYVFDWKKNDQGSGKKGVTILKTSEPFEYHSLWSHNNKVQVLASNYSYKGWERGVKYHLKAEYGIGYINVYIDNDKVLEYKNPDLYISGGKIGFYNYSQSNVSYSNFGIQTEPKCRAGYLLDISTDKCYKVIDGMEADVPNHIYYGNPVCKVGDYNSNIKMCENTASCTADGVLNEDIKKCELSPDKIHITSTKINTDIDGYNPACMLIDECPMGSYLQTFADLDKPVCVSQKLTSCPKDSTYNEKLNRCESAPFCEQGYKANKEGKCVKEYKWYDYECQDGWEGPAKPSRDCYGACGNYNCSCNPKTPIANNCRKKISDVYSQKTIRKTKLILHEVKGSLIPEEFGKIKGFPCGKNCEFVVTKVVGKGNDLCFEKKNGQKSCLTVNGCNFYGEVKNNQGLKELQVGGEVIGSPIKCPEGYTLNIDDNTKCEKPLVTSKSLIPEKKFYLSDIQLGVTFDKDIDLYANGFKYDGTRVYSLGSYHNSKINMGEGANWHNGVHSGDVTSGGTEAIRINTGEWRAQGVDYVQIYLYTYTNGATMNDFNAKFYFYDSQNTKREYSLVGDSELRGQLMKLDLHTGKIEELDNNHIVYLGDKCEQGYIYDKEHDICYIPDDNAEIDLDNNLYLKPSVCDNNCKLAVKHRRGRYQYELTEGGQYIKPVIASPDTIGCYDSSTIYNPTLKQCVITDNLDLRNWEVVDKGGTRGAQWTFSSDGAYGYQGLNTSNPTLLLHRAKFGEEAFLEGNIKVTDPCDDDAIGLTFGVNDGATHYYTFGWWNNTQCGSKLRNKEGFILKEWTGTKVTKTLASNLGGGKGWKYNTTYKIGVRYAPGVIIGYVNDKEVIRYENKDLKLKGKVGFYGLSQPKVSYWNFHLTTSPKCPDGFSYQNIDKQCVKIPKTSSDYNKVFSTCKMNGHIGAYNTPNGIISIVSGGDITNKQAQSIKGSTNGIFSPTPDNNSTKSTVYFWDSYQKGFLGFLQFIKDIPEDQRKNNFTYKDKTTIALGHEGFTAIKYNPKANKSYYASVDAIGTGMTDSECTEIAQKYGVKRFQSKDWLSDLLTGNRTNGVSSTTPICSDGVYVKESKTCANAKGPSPYIYCLYGTLNNKTGMCDITSKCVLEDTSQKPHKLDDDDYAYKIELSNSDYSFKCSPLTCMGGECKVETCPEGTQGSLSPIKDLDLCAEQECDGFKPFNDYCGVDGGCPKGDKYLVRGNGRGSCYEYYCDPNDLEFNPKTKKCKKLACPANTIEQSDGSCKRKY